MKKISILVLLLLMTVRAQMPQLLDTAFLQIKLNSATLNENLNPVLSLEMLQKQMNDELDFYAELDAYNVNPFEFFMPGIFGQHNIGISKSKASYFAMCNDGRVYTLSIIALDNAKTFQKSLASQDLTQWKKVKNAYFHQRGKLIFFYDKNFAYLIEKKVERKEIKTALRARLDKAYGEGNYTTPMLNEWSWEDYEYNYTSEAVAEEETVEEIVWEEAEEVNAVSQEEAEAEAQEMADALMDELVEVINSAEETKEESNTIDLSYDQEDSIVALIKIEMHQKWLEGFRANGNTNYWSDHVVKGDKAMTLFGDYSEIVETTNSGGYMMPIQRELNGLLYNQVGDFLLEAYTQNNELIFDVNYISEDVAELGAIFKNNYTSNVTKYLPNEPAYVSGGAAMESQAYYDFIMNMANRLPESELASKIKSGYALFDLAFDDKAMSEFLPGEVYFHAYGSLTDSITKVTYDYDENFEYHRVEKREAITLPKFYYFVATQNEEAMGHILNIAHYEPYFTKDDKGIYTLDSKEIPQLYFRVYDGLLMITNDAEFIQNPKANGNKGLTPNNFVWDIAASMEALETMAGDQMRSKEKETIKVLEQYFDRLELDMWNVKDGQLNNNIKLISKNPNEAFFLSVARLIEGLNK